jgi:RNA polymerase sigma factor (sigma-70 family)
MAIPPFSQFLEEQRTPVYRFLLASVGPDDADDVFQETFLAALRAYGRLKDASNLRGWVLTIAARKVIDLARSRRRQPLPIPRLEDLAEAAPDARSTDGSDPLWVALHRLPTKQRAAVAMRHVLDMAYGDIAAALGITEEAVRANVYQGTKRLRKEWRA